MTKRRREQRGLSTVVGAVFMIIVIAGALGVLTMALQSQDRVTGAILEKTNTELGRLSERIDISDVRVNNNKLNMTVTNTGGAAAVIKSVYVVNETASTKVQYRYDLNAVIDGRNSTKNIGQSLSLIIKNDTNYSIKVVSEAGNTAATSLTSLSKVGLPMALYVIPPTPTPGENVTLLYTVTNNLTNSNLGREVSLRLTYKLDCSPTGPNCEVVQKAAPPSNVTRIAPGNTALLKWVFKVTAPDNTYLTFNASLANAKQGNYVIEKAFINLIEATQTSFAAEQVVGSTLVQKPEIFPIVPGPFGDSAQKGLWGVVVANPINQTMSISRIAINVFSSKIDASHKIVADGCSNTAIFPAVPAEWTCPHDGTIEWKDLNNPEQINGLEVKSFLVRVTPGSLGANTPEPAFMVVVTVFTSFGQFAKTGFSANMLDSSASLANVYFTDTLVEATATDDAHMFGHITGINSGIPKTIFIAVADLDTSSSTHIQSGGKLIVNVPRGFIVQTPLPVQTGFTNPPTISIFSDGSTQIVATLSEHVGDLGGTLPEAKVLTFVVTPPTVTSKKVYMIHALLDGKTNGGTPFSVDGFAGLAMLVQP